MLSRSRSGSGISGRRRSPKCISSKLWNVYSRVECRRQTNDLPTDITDLESLVVDRCIADNGKAYYGPEDLDD